MPNCLSSRGPIRGIEEHASRENHSQAMIANSWAGSGASFTISENLGARAAKPDVYTLLLWFQQVDLSFDHYFAVSAV